MADIGKLITELDLLHKHLHELLMEATRERVYAQNAVMPNTDECMAAVRAEMRLEREVRGLTETIEFLRGRPRNG